MGTIRVIVRDPNHTAVPYETTGHTFFLRIMHAGRFPLTPLWFAGVDYGLWTHMQLQGKRGGRIYSEVRVPPGAYLVECAATCYNVKTLPVQVTVNEDDVIEINMLPSYVYDCIWRAILGLQAGTVVAKDGKAVAVQEVAGPEVQKAVSVLDGLARKLAEVSGVEYKPEDISRMIKDRSQRPPPVKE